MIVFNSLKQIKAISFDLDDTLYDNVPIIEKAEAWYQQMLAEHPFYKVQTTDFISEIFVGWT